MKLIYCGHVIPKKIRYHHRATNAYNYTAVHNTPNGPSYTAGHNASNKL